MTQTISEYAGRLVVWRCWCGIQHAVPESLSEMQMRQFNDRIQMTPIYCPMGHKHFPVGDREVDRVQAELHQEQRRLQRERQRHDQTRAELRDATNERNAERAAKSRLKNRIAKGVCPCCHRSFQDLHRHMANQHPDFTSTP